MSQSERGALLQWTRGHVAPNARVSVNNRVSNDTAQYNAFNFFSLAPGYL